MDLQTPPQSYQMLTPSSNPFTGWRGASLYAEDSHEQNLRKACTKGINWDPLIDYASGLKDQYEMPRSPSIDHGRLSLGPSAAI
jgi:hypothetical protein